jgi:phospholipid/cholesterol/gamma-HCH transport system permease protein
MTEKQHELEYTELAPAVNDGEERRWFEILIGPGHSLLDDLVLFIQNQFERIGIISLFFFNTLFWLIAKPSRRDNLLHSFYTIGVLSIPVVMLTGTFIGMVLSVQTYTQFKSLGIETRIGAVINLSLLRELGPVLAATMLAGRVGSSIAAELGTMRVTEQIDALTSMGTNPIHYLVVPRFLSCLVLIPALTAMADFAGVIGGAFYCTQLLSIDSHLYWKNSSNFVTLFDLFAGMFKSTFFGAAIAIISCFQGFHCEPGAEGVGKAATKSFVLSFVAILFLDLLLGIILDRLYLLFWTPPQLIGGG